MGKSGASIETCIFFPHVQILFYSEELSAILHDPDFLLRQFIEVINETVNLRVGGIDLALEVGFFMVRFCRCQLLVEGQHLLDRCPDLCLTNTVKTSTAPIIKHLQLNGVKEF